MQNTKTFRWMRDGPPSHRSLFPFYVLLGSALNAPEKLVSKHNKRKGCIINKQTQQKKGMYHK